MTAVNTFLQVDLADVDSFTREFLEEVQFAQGVTLARATTNDLYMALARTVRQQLMSRWLDTVSTQMHLQAKVVAYLSAEYLLGRQLDNALLAAGLTETAERSMKSLGLDLNRLRDAEVEPGLGNGGLGRLAACFIDSLATLEIPAVGYGIRYEYGIFRQTFVGGEQVEQPDSWLTNGSPWEFPRPEMAVTVRFGGQTEHYEDSDGVTRSRWDHGWEVLGIPYNYMVPGYRRGNVNTLRLWSAKATQAFDLKVFNAGDYLQAVRSQAFAENISKVLYPKDSTPQGKELRLQQQYFFVACSLRDFIDNTLPADFDMRRLPERVIFQLNDTHPVIAIPELMRILVDEQRMDWDEAWAISRQCFAYTCHTLLPEALEVWPVALLGRLLPRHLEIIYRINEDFLADVRNAYPDDELRARGMSIIQETEGLVGWAAGFTTLREIAPLLTALMISGRVGANNTAELGTMVVTEQLDALRVLAIDPISFLILPRFIGIVVTLFMMTLYADALAILGATYCAKALLHVEPASFYHGLTSGLLGFGDVANGLTKSVLFGVVMALASCHFGLATQGGAPGVGRAVNATVVASAAGIFVLDYFVSFLLG